MPSFDVISEVDLHALTNAVDQARRIIDNRFDFKGVDAEFERKERVIAMRAEALQTNFGSTCGATKSIQS